MIAGTARTLISSLTPNPVVLALVMFNLLFVGVVYFSARDMRASFDRTTSTLLLQQAKMAEMLYNCAPIERPH